MDTYDLLANQRVQFVAEHDTCETMDRIMGDLMAGVAKAESIAVYDEWSSDFWDRLDPQILEARKSGLMIVYDIR